MSALDFREGVYYPKGGLYSIIQQLIDLGNELGVHYQYSAAIKRIVTTGGSVKAVTLQNGQHIDANIVISNADLHFTETQLLRENDRSYPVSYWAKREAGPSALLMYLGVKGKLPQLQHHNLFFADKWKENFDAIFTDKKLPAPASVYICKSSETDMTVAPKGHENVFILVPLPAGIKLGGKRMENVANIYLKQIEKNTGITDLRSRIVVKKFFGPDDFTNTFNAWQGTALGPSHILRQSALFRTPNKSKKVKNLYYVGGATLPGIGLPMCLIGAELLYKRLAGDTRGGPVDKIRTIVGSDE